MIANADPAKSMRVIRKHALLKHYGMNPNIHNAFLYACVDYQDIFCCLAPCSFFACSGHVARAGDRRSDPVDHEQAAGAGDSKGRGPALLRICRAYASLCEIASSDDIHLIMFQCTYVRT